MSNLIYRKNGDYFLPEMGLTETERQPLGKYGRMRLRYLKENRPGLYTRLILNGKLMEHLQETETTVQSRLEVIMNQLVEQNNVTEELKDWDQMAWVGAMNSIQNQAEEIIFAELIFI